MSDIKRELEYSDAEDGEIEHLPMAASTPRLPSNGGLLPEDAQGQAQGGMVETEVHLANYQGKPGDSQGPLGGAIRNQGQVLDGNASTTNSLPESKGQPGGQWRPSGGLVMTKGQRVDDQGQLGDYGGGPQEPTGGLPQHLDQPANVQDPQEPPVGLQAHLKDQVGHPGYPNIQPYGRQDYQVQGQGYQGHQGHLYIRGRQYPLDQQGNYVQGVIGEQVGRLGDQSNAQFQQGGRFGQPVYMRNVGGEQGQRGRRGHVRGQGRGHSGRGGYHPQPRCSHHRRRNCRACNAPLHIRVNALLDEIAARIEELDGRRPTQTQVRNMLNNTNF